MKPATRIACLAVSLGIAGCAGREVVHHAARAAGASHEAPRYGRPELVYVWTRMAYEFRSETDAREYEANRVYEKAPLAGVDLDRRNNVYVTTPRWLDSRVPSSLNRVVVAAGKPLLRPFPSWEDNRLGDPRAFQNVLGVEVDSTNRMWVVDMGWVAGVEPTPDGAQKIVVLDLDHGTEIARYAIPDSVADRKTSFLNDLAIDERRQVAFISDSGNRSGSPTASGLIVYDLASNTARRVLDKDASVRDDAARTLSVDGEPVFPGNRLAVGINGLALTPDGSRLYWSITTGDAVYWAPTEVLLRAGATAAEVSAAVRGPLRIGGGSDGLSADDRGRIYITNLAKNRVEVVDPADGKLTTVAEGKGMVWPDSLSWDTRGGLFFSTNHLNHAFAGVIDFDKTEPNFRIFRVQTDASGKGFVR